MKINKFEVSYEDADDLEKAIELDENAPLSQLSYTILVTFNIALNDLYKFIYKGKIYDCNVMANELLIRDEKALCSLYSGIYVLNVFFICCFFSCVNILLHLNI